MSSSGWQPVTENTPCHVCGKPDWCSVSADHKKAICRRKDDGTGSRRTDKSGQDYWLYELNGHRGPSLPEAVPPKEEERQTPDKADPQTLDRVYGALLDELSMIPAHRQDLHQRGLSEAAIKRGGYRSLPQKGREDLAHKLLYRFGAEVCGR